MALYCYIVPLKYRRTQDFTTDGVHVVWAGPGSLDPGVTLMNFDSTFPVVGVSVEGALSVSGFTSQLSETETAEKKRTPKTTLRCNSERLLCSRVTNIRESPAG